MTDDPEKHNHKSCTSNSKMDSKKASFPNSAVNANKAVNLDNSLKATTFTRQDGASGSQVSKVQQKGPSRYKGNPTGSPASRNEFYRNKSSFPRGKGNGEKRGKPRGALTTQPVTNEKAEPEAGSIQFPGGKKQNFDDMWGFHFAPRESRNQGATSLLYGRSHPPFGGNMRNQYLGSGGGGNRAKYAKDYLLANCQFLVRLGEDYTVYLADPNILVKWDLIEQVRIRIDGETPKCPICLDFPVAAKITKCGHIYCWSCFLHYLALSDNKVRTCPICYEPVSRKDLKSVTLLSQEGIHVGSKIDMQLMVRAKDSLVACPVEKFEGWESKFCKILQVTPSTMIRTVLNNERAELDIMYAAEPDAPEVCFVQEALQELSAREVTLNGMEVELGQHVGFLSAGLLAPDVLTGGAPAAVSTLNTQEALMTAAPVGISKPKTRNDSMSSNSSCGYEDCGAAQRHADPQGDCYFYQIKDGRNVFLHPLNMAMLWRELGPDPEKWPQILTFEVIDIESKSATEEARKRMKFLRHLPKNSPFELVEVSMKEWGISPQVYSDFVLQINQREQRRKKRAKEEKNLEKKLQAREAAEFNKLRNHPQILSPQEFPAFGEHMFGSELVYSDFPEQLYEQGATEVTLDTASDELLASDFAPGTSFAQIAGKAPIKKSPTFPLTKSAWGASVAVSTIGQAQQHNHSDSENDGEGGASVPNYRASVSTAIEKAMADLCLDRDTSDTSLASPSHGAAGGKRKKSRKGKVLFSTGLG